MRRVLALLKKKRVAIPLAVVALYALLGFLVVPPVARAQLEKRLGEALHRRVTVREVAFNPFALAVTVRGFSMTEAKGEPFVAFEELFVNANLFQLVRGRIGFDAIRLVKPSVAVTLLENGALNCADLLEPEPGAPPAPQPEKDAKPITIVVAAFDLADGAFVFNDLKRQEPFTATLAPLALSLRDFTTETGRDSRYAFDAKLGDATLEYDGDFSARPLRSKGKLSMQGIRLDAFQPYVAEATQLELRDGVVGISGSYELDGAAAPLRFVLLDGKVSLQRLRVEGAGEQEPVLELGGLSVTVPRADLASRAVQVKDVVLSDAVVRARREKGGEVQLVRLARPSRAAPEAPPQGADAGVAVAPSAPGPGGVKPPAPWTVTVDRFALERWALHWRDLALEYPVTMKVDRLGLEVLHARWPLEGAVDAKLGFRWMDKGAVSLSGPVTPSPLAARLALQLKDFDLAPFDGYLWEHALNGTLQRGSLTASLDASVADGGAASSASGSVQLRDFAMLDGEDRPLLDLRALDLEGLDYRGDALSLERIGLTGLSLKVEKDEAGGLNLSRLAKPPRPGAAPAADATPAKKEQAPGLAVKVGAVVLDDVGVEWLDKTTRPAFAASVKRLGGKLTNVTWPQTKKTGVALAGRVDQAPLKVNGALLVNGKDSLADVKLTLDGYDLPRTTPYSVKYVAQPITLGKLSLDLSYKVARRTIDAQNRVVIDQLDFGDAVPEPGPDAKKLPLGLAVAILSDKNGRIDLDLPMTGNLDDPEFEWGGMVWKTLGNLLEKVATAPFSLVAGLFAGDNPDALKSLAFAPGARAPTPDEAQKVGTLAKLLAERPRLKLELRPGADPVADRDAVARALLRQSLLAKRSQPGVSADGGVAEVEPAEYLRLVAAAWRRLQGPPDAGVGDPPAEQMEGDLAARQRVSEEDLEALRRDRAAWVQAALEDQGVPVARVFVAQGAETANARASVDIELR